MDISKRQLLKSLIRQQQVPHFRTSKNGKRYRAGRGSLKQELKEHTKEKLGFMDILTFNKNFPDEQAVIDYFVKIRYAGEMTCPFCGEKHSVARERNRPKLFHCNKCKSSFSIFKGTIFEKSYTDLRKWFLAINFMLTDKKGISAKQLQRQVGTTYKTA
ncbi:MAG: transposase [Bacteroidales bacterium]|jgi:transposase-like protein|nr:transposase [Bacteroidales bacterium]